MAMRFFILEIVFLAFVVRHAASLEAERQQLQPATSAVAVGGRSLKTYYADDNGDDEDAPEKYICTCTCEKEEEKKEGDKVVHYYYPGYYHSWCKHCRRMLHEPAAGGSRALRGYVYHKKEDDEDNGDDKDEPTCECDCELKEEEEEEDKMYSSYYKVQPKKQHRKYYKKSKCIQYGWVVKEEDP